jgi:hypothetical protein
MLWWLIVLALLVAAGLAAIVTNQPRFTTLFTLLAVILLVLPESFPHQMPRSERSSTASLSMSSPRSEGGWKLSARLDGQADRPRAILGLTVGRPVPAARRADGLLFGDPVGRSSLLRLSELLVSS